MAPQFLFDLAPVDLSKVQLGPEEIEKINPHRGIMRLLDGIHWMNDEVTQAVAYHDIKAEAFWVPGHIPGRPLFPGVLMLEAAAQLASYLTLVRLHKLGVDAKFMGFVGTDKVKFRGQVVPGDRLLILGREVEFRKRRCICEAQGVVNGNLVFEGTITGMTM